MLIGSSYKNENRVNLRIVARESTRLYVVINMIHTIWGITNSTLLLQHTGKCANVSVTMLKWRLTELPGLPSEYVSVLGSTASSASRILSTGISSLKLLVDSTSFSPRSFPRCLSSCTATTCTHTHTHSDFVSHHLYDTTDAAYCTLRGHLGLL